MSATIEIYTLNKTRKRHGFVEACIDAEDMAAVIDKTIYLVRDDDGQITIFLNVKGEALELEVEPPEKYP